MRRVVEFRSLEALEAALRMRSGMSPERLRMMPLLAFRPTPEERRKLEERLLPIRERPRSRPRPGSII
jgi:hypothetical protein